MTLRTRIAAGIAANVALALSLAALLGRLARSLELGVVSSWAVAMLVMVPAILWSAGRIAGRVVPATNSLSDGLRALRDGDFSMRLASTGTDELATLKSHYNEVADGLRASRADLYQKELLLDTILQRTPMGVVLVDGRGHIVYSNPVARELLRDGGRLDGYALNGVVERLAPPMREAFAAGGDSIVTVRTEESDETVHLSQRTFRLNTLEHRLILVERLTGELRRKEVEVWKKAIRVINHEMNNTIAPISSLFHSARIAQSSPEHRGRLDEIHTAIEERLAFLRSFLESYARFARLPQPRKERMRWEEVITDTRALYPFRVEGDLRIELDADPAQIQQVLINLLKNALESGSAAESIAVSVRRAPEGVVFSVSDAGAGMPDDIARQALVPFFTTKPGGSGLGLALCNEIVEAHGGRMRLRTKEGEGTEVTCWLPG